jgi:Flp pilus assembly protein TadD
MSTELYDAFRQGELFLRAGQPAEAARLVAPVVEAEPGSNSALELYARALSGSAQLEKAEAAFRLLVERRPDDGWAHFALARTLERQGKDGAEERRIAAALGFVED